ncbi:MAG: DUF421 domain-containing protein [Oscillospiraceae bacterium]
MAIVFIRTLIIFLAVLITTRLAGKRQMGELELNELIVAVLMANLASHPLQDIGIPLINGLIPVITLFCCELIIAGINLKSVGFRAFLHGKPSILIADGVVNQREMLKNRLSLEELTENLRNHSITDIKKVKFAILETNGTLNAILFPAERPVTAAQMNMQVEDPGFPSIIINDGKVMKENLKLLGKDEQWLRDELRKRNAKGPEDVYLMILNNMDQIYYLPQEKVK